MHTLPFPLQEHQLHTGKLQFCRRFAAPKLPGLQYLGCTVLQAKGNPMAYPKIGSLKQTIWQLRVAKFRQWCGKEAQQDSAATESLMKKRQNYIKTLFFDVMSEFQKDL
jgi:hypothetical protein